MERILHQLIVDPRWCRISSISSTSFFPCFISPRQIRGKSFAANFPRPISNAPTFKDDNQPIKDTKQSNKQVQNHRESESHSTPRNQFTMAEDGPQSLFLFSQTSQLQPPTLVVFFSPPPQKSLPTFHHFSPRLLVSGWWFQPL